jgi:hypothetical protein
MNQLVHQSIEESFMERLNRFRFAGLSCMVAALLWIVALLIEYDYNLFPPGSGPLFVMNQSMFAFAMVGYILGILGLFRARAAGGWFGKITLGLFLTGWVAIFLALVVSLLTGSTALELLAPIGGILGNLGGLLAGIAIALARRWHGWQRFAVLIYGLYFLLVIVLPNIIAEQEPTLITESGWALAWLLIGAAVYTSNSTVQPAQTALATEGTHQ